MSKNCLKIQRLYRGYHGRLKFMSIKEIYLQNISCIKIQSIIRSNLCRTRILSMSKYCLKIQKLFRGYSGRLKFRNMKEIRRQNKVIELQRVYRGYLGRLSFRTLKKVFEAEKLKKINTSTVKIQTIFRGYISRKLKVKLICAVKLHAIIMTIVTLTSGYESYMMINEH